MALNTAAAYTRVADNQWVISMTAANTNTNIDSGTSYLVATADATNGGFCREVLVKAAPGNSTAATVARLWMNNGSTTGTAANNVLIRELGIPATTASSTQPQSDFVIPVGFALKPGHKLYMTFGTAPGGSASFMGLAIMGAY